MQRRFADPNHARTKLNRISQLIHSTEMRIQELQFSLTLLKIEKKSCEHQLERHVTKAA